MTDKSYEPPKGTEKRDRWGLLPRLNPDGEPKGWIARTSQPTERQKRTLQVLTEQPRTRRRWYLFWLSTTILVLVLAGIAAWGMSYWPWFPTPVRATPTRAPSNRSRSQLGTDVTKLLKLLNGKSTVDRGMAAMYLGELGAKGELGADRDQVLTKLLTLAQSDPNPIVKVRATEAITKIEKGG